MGTREAVRLMKLHRLHVTRALCDQPLKGQGVRVDQYGFPFLLTPTLRKGLIRRDPEAIRAALTALTLSRGELGGTPIDFNPIVTPTNPDCELIDDIVTFAEIFLKRHDIQPYQVADSTLLSEDYIKGLTVDQWTNDAFQFH